MKRMIGLAVLAVLSISAAAFAEEVPYEPGKVSVAVPTGWKSAAQEKDGQAILAAADPTNNAAVIYAVINAKNVAKAMKGLDKQLSGVLTDVKKGKFKKVKVNGLAGQVATGTAKNAQGQEISMFLLLAQTPNKKVLLVLGMVATAKKAEFDPALKEVMAGIKPLK